VLSLPLWRAEVVCGCTLLSAMLFALPVHAWHAATDSLRAAEVWGEKRRLEVAAATPVQQLDTLSLLRRGVTDMSGALRQFAGVNLRDYGGAGGLKTVSVRGLGAAHTAVTLDGLPVNDTQQGQIDLGRFSLGSLSSLSLSTLDSPQLLCPVRTLAAAVVGLRSFQPDTLRRSMQGHAALRQAAFHTYATSLQLDHGLGRRTWLGGAAEWFWAKNDYPFTVENGVATAHLHRTNSRMQKYNFQLNLLSNLRGGSLEAKAYFYHNHRRLPGQVVYYVNENNERLTEQNAFAQLRYVQQRGRWRWMAAAKWDWQKSFYHNFSAQYPGGLLSQHYWQREAYATSGVAYQFAPALRIAYASDYAYASLNSNLQTDHAVSRHTWLQALSLRFEKNRWQCTARATMTLLKNRSKGGETATNYTHITPTLTLAYLALTGKTSLRLRAGYKESFRAPTFTENYYYHLGSVTLRPELARQLSAGITLQVRPAAWFPLVLLTLDGYKNKVRDRIVSIPKRLYVWQTVNLGDVRGAGIDLATEMHFQPAPKHLLVLTGNYSWQRARNYADPALSTYKKQLAYTPLHSGTASLAWESPWLSGSISLTASDSRWCTNEHSPTTRLDAWTEWGFSLWRNFALGRKCALSLRANLQNVFDERYEVIGRYPMPGRAYQVEASLKF